MPIYITFRSAGANVATANGIESRVHGMSWGDSKLTPADLVNAFDYGVTAPLDNSSGGPTGKRQHKPIVIVKDTDRVSSPLFQGEKFLPPKLHLSFFNGNVHGTRTPFCTIVLTNPSVLGIHRKPGPRPGSLWEEIKFEYTNIEATFNNATGLRASWDDWL